MPAPLIFIPGTIIGNNLIIEKDIILTEKKHRGYWKCKCLKCGNIRSVRTDNFKNKCKSCAAKERHPIQDNLINKIFGYWKVIGKANRPNYWVCECQNCGTVKEVFRGGLTSGQSKSCGCISSWGETQIVYLLNLYNINYKKEFCFPNLKTDKNKNPRFDFALFDKNNEIFCLIEFDGRQHYSFDKNWKMTEEDFLRLKYIDELKNNYCKEHNIQLYRFNKDTILKKEIENISLAINKGNN